MNSTELLNLKGGLFSLKINLADAFDPETEKESAELMTQDTGASHSIVIRELTGAEMMSIQGTPENEVMGALEKLLPSVIIEHSFTDEKGNITGNGDVLRILRMSSNLLLYVITKWQTSSPLQKRTLRESGEPQAS